MMFRKQLGRVAVYCGSNPGRDPAFARLAAELGGELARRNIELVYGGSDAGLMRIVASAALAGGGRVTGIHPEGHPIEPPQRDLTRLCFVNSMAERKAKMLELADAWLALPGGFGTLDEFFDANAEALIETRGVEDRIVDCFSQSVFSFGASYWDCGNCQRYKNHAGTGNTRTCHPDTNQG